MNWEIWSSGYLVIDLFIDVVNWKIN